MSWLVALLAHMCRSRPHARRMQLARAVIAFILGVVGDARETFSPRRLRRYARLELLLDRIVRSLLMARMRMLKGRADAFQLTAFSVRRPARSRRQLARRLAALQASLVDIDRICRCLNRKSLLHAARCRRALAARPRAGDPLLASASLRAIAQAMRAQGSARPRALDLSG